MGSSSGWFVVLGSALSIISSLVTTLLTQRWTENQKAVERQAAAKAKWSELQLEWLIALQDAINEMMNIGVFIDGRVDSMKLLDFHATVIKISQRISDKTTRDLANKLVKSVYDTCILNNDNTVDTTTDDLFAVQERIGLMIRTIYES